MCVRNVPCDSDQKYIITFPSIFIPCDFLSFLDDFFRTTHLRTHLRTHPRRIKSFAV